MRFLTKHWHRAGGGIQSLSFYLQAFLRLRENPSIRALTEWKRKGDQIRIGKISIHDYGCASGDGTAFLQAVFPGSDIVGFDHSSEGIAEARRRWPTMEFEIGDLRDPKPADMIWTSHTLEHLEDPADVVKRCIERSQVFIAITPPTSAEASQDSGEEHEFSVPLEEWLSEVREPDYKDVYNTLRINPESGRALEEGNVLMVWG